MQWKLATALALVALAHLPAALAEDANCCCPRCHVVCVPSSEIEPEKRTAFDVECKYICVPKIRFPWQPCCEPQCAWVRKVKVLQRIDYECPRCKHKWTAMCDSPAGPSGACPHGACAVEQIGVQANSPLTPPAPTGNSASNSAGNATSRRLFPPLRTFFGESPP